jgi:tetratricopeptide (TPR) repeat protein
MTVVRRFSLLVVVAGVVVVVALLISVAGVGISGGSSPGHERATETETPGNVGSGGSVAPPSADGSSLDAAIAAAQARLRRLPEDYQTWAELGLAYVEQAKNKVDPAYYPKAEGALQKSLSINRRDNYVAMTGMASLEAARHDFTTALQWGHKATSINPYSAAAWGIKSDALLQLGRYRKAFEAIQKENDLEPGTPAFARASYAWELRGDLDRARETMQRAFTEASTPVDQAFAAYYLGELAFNAGRPQAALRHYEAGLKADPTYPPLTEGKAKAEWALGREESALRLFADVVGRVPQLTYVMEYGELLESLGRTEEAQRQYQLFEAEAALFEASGVSLDLDAMLFYANHGDPEKALALAREGVRQRPFIEVYDALAWALYKNGNYREALAAERKAMRLGTRNALFYAHAGLIEKALGRDAAARRHLAEALEINPWFSPLLAPRVEAALEELGGPA